MIWLVATAFAAEGLQRCAALASEDPAGREPYRCAYQVARTTGDYEAAIAWLEPIVQAHPDRAWAQLTIGNLLTDQGRIDEGFEHYAVAREGFAAAGDARGEVFTLLNSANWLGRGDDYDGAIEAVDAAAAVATAAGDDQLLRISRIEGVRMRAWAGDRPGEAHRRARELLDELTDSDEDYQARLLLLTTLRTLAEQHDLLDEAIQWNRQLVDLTRARGDAYATASARRSDLTLATVYPERTHALHGGDLEALARQVIAEAEAGEHPFAVGSARCILAELQSDARGARECVAFSDRDGSVSSRVVHRVILSEILRAKGDPGWSAVLDEAEAITREAEHPMSDVLAARARVAADEGRLDEAARLATEAVEAWEAFQTRESDEDLDVKLGYAANHTYIAASLQVAAGHPDEALKVLERLRARDLLHQLDGVALDPPGLTDLQAALREGEAALVLQLPVWFGLREGPEAWGWLVTRTGVHLSAPLPDRLSLSERVPLLDGLLASGDPGTEAIEALSADVLGPFLDVLPPETEHLIVVADGPLHAAPFAALPPLRSLHVSMAPSVGVWRHLRGLEDRTGAGAVALADPEGAEPLPASAREVAALRAVEDDVAVLQGAAATAEALRAALAEGPSLVHIAAHATVDEVFPEQSALVLTGEPLTSEDIADLDLRGAVVVLAACRSAAGPSRWSEGPIALARAFFQGGARAVIGSLWPLRDDEAAALFTAFYDHLGEGQTVGEALARARDDLRASGAPPRAWAGVVVLGDATARPLPPAPRRWGWPLLALGAALLGGVGLWRARKTGRPM